MKKPAITKVLAAVAVVAVAGAYVVPMVAGAADTTINSNINSVISLFTTSGTVNVDVIPTAAGAQTVAKDVVTVSTNAPGYTLTLADKDTNTSLVSGGNTIAAASGTQTTPLALTAGTWGYRVDNVGGFGAGPTGALASQPLSTLKYAGVPTSASPNTLKDTSVSASGDTTDVWYSVAANTSQASGLYTDTVTYTATAKN